MGQAKQRKAEITALKSAKPTLVVADIYSMLAEKDAYTIWREKNATDMIMTGNFIDGDGASVYMFVLLSTKLTETAAKKLIASTYTDIIRAKGYEKYVMAWVPMNDLKEMVVCDLEKDTDGFRVATLSEVMLRTRGYEIMKTIPGCVADAEVFYKKACEA